ncbi:relaxase/mobilization nuclease domain-containing protein [Kitasatospora sp. NPDC052896]|uniref:relaxase/mobilization nuclease domain-containing protein n=1 Tax=Kitasatospora sp. NPDC052896 TaxID=3364061 RepID=UPI0037C91A1C
MCRPWTASTPPPPRSSDGDFLIPSIDHNGGGTYALIRYLYGPGKADEHEDPHMIASWNGFAPDPAPERERGPRDTIAKLAAQLDLPVNALSPADRNAPTVWHCSVRAAPEDPILTDVQWATIARRLLHATGIAPRGDIKACRWVAVRHNADHIHIVATLMRQDGRTPKNGRDFTRAQREARKIEIDYGLRRVAPGDGTAAKRPTQAEQHRAKRLSQAQPARERLRSTVRLAVAAAQNEEQFFLALDQLGVLHKKSLLPSGDVKGYSVSFPGESAWFSGSTLASDLSLPKIRKRLAAVDPNSHPSKNTSAWRRASRAAEAIPHTLHSSDDETGQAHIAALSELLDVTAALSPARHRDRLHHAADLFERANRSRIKPRHHKASALHRATRELFRSGGPKDGGTLAALLLLLAVAALAAAEWHQQRGHQQQYEAAWQTGTHLQATYHQVAAQPLADLTRRTPDTNTLTRYEHTLLTVLPDHAQRITTDPTWPALAVVLHYAEQVGHDTDELLGQAAQPHNLTNANSPAQQLLWSVRNRTRTGKTTADERTTAALLTKTASTARTTTTATPSAPAPTPLAAGRAANDPARRR